MKKRTKRILAMLLASAMILQQGSTVGVLATETEPVSETVAETTAAETMAQETQALETTAETKAPETQATETALGTTQTETAATEQTETAAPQTEQTKTPAATEVTEATETTETAAETTGSTEQSEMTSQETTVQETTETPAQTEEKTEAAEETATEKATEAATETEAPKTNFTYEDGRVIITAVAEAAANLPQDAQIHADYMAPGTAAYNEAAAALEAAYAGQDVVLDYVFYDIYFTAASAGDGRIEPEAGTVTVSMQFKKAELTPDEDVEVQSYDVVHVENGKAQEVLSTVQTTGDGSVASVGFTSDSFSPYGFVTVGQEPVKVATIGTNEIATIDLETSNPFENLNDAQDIKDVQNASVREFTIGTKGNGNIQAGETGYRVDFSVFFEGNLSNPAQVYYVDVSALKEYFDISTDNIPTSASACGEIKKANQEVMGHWFVDTTKGMVYFVFDQTPVGSLNTNASLYFWANAKQVESGEKKKVDFNIGGDEYSFEWYPTHSSLEVEKSDKNTYDDKMGTVSFTVTVTSKDGDNLVRSLSDYFTLLSIAEPDSFTVEVKDPDGELLDSTTTTSDNSFTTKLNSEYRLEKGKSMTFTYTLKVDKSRAVHGDNFIKNSANIGYKDNWNEDGSKGASWEKKFTASRPHVDKEVKSYSAPISPEEPGTATWTLTVEKGDSYLEDGKTILDDSWSFEGLSLDNFENAKVTLYYGADGASTLETTIGALRDAVTINKNGKNFSIDFRKILDVLGEESVSQIAKCVIEYSTKVTTGNLQSGQNETVTNDVTVEKDGTKTHSDSANIEVKNSSTTGLGVEKTHEDITEVGSGVKKVEWVSTLTIGAGSYNLLKYYDDVSMQGQNNVTIDGKSIYLDWFDTSDLSMTTGKNSIIESIVIKADDENDKNKLDPTQFTLSVDKKDGQNRYGKDAYHGFVLTLLDTTGDENKVTFSKDVTITIKYVSYFDEEYARRVYAGITLTNTAKFENDKGSVEASDSLSNAFVKGGVGKYKGTTDNKEGSVYWRVAVRGDVLKTLYYNESNGKWNWPSRIYFEDVLPENMQLASFLTSSSTGNIEIKVGYLPDTSGTGNVSGYGSIPVEDSYIVENGRRLTVDVLEILKEYYKDNPPEEGKSLADLVFIYQTKVVDYDKYLKEGQKTYTNNVILHIGDNYKFEASDSATFNPGEGFKKDGTVGTDGYATFTVTGFGAKVKKLYESDKTKYTDVTLVDQYGSALKFDETKFDAKYNDVSIVTDESANVYYTVDEDTHTIRFHIKASFVGEEDKLTYKLKVIPTNITGDSLSKNEIWLSGYESVRDSMSVSSSGSGAFGSWTEIYMTIHKIGKYIDTEQTGTPEITENLKGVKFTLHEAELVGGQLQYREPILDTVITLADGYGSFSYPVKVNTLYAIVEDKATTPARYQAIEPKYILFYYEKDTQKPDAELKSKYEELDVEIEEIAEVPTNNVIPFAFEIVNEEKEYLGQLTVQKIEMGNTDAIPTEIEYYNVQVAANDPDTVLEDVKVTGLATGKTQSIKDNIISFEISKKDTVVISDLPLGEYTVTETVSGTKKYEASYKVGSGDAVKTPASVVLNNTNNNATVQVINTYKTPSETQINLSGTKTMDGNPASTAFTFKIEDKTVYALGDEHAEIANDTTTNSTDGKFSFSDIKFKQARTYTFEVSEVAGNDPKITYVTNKYVVTVNVGVNTEKTAYVVTSVNVDGKPVTAVGDAYPLTAERVATFANTTKLYDDATLALSGTKTLDDKLASAEFTFKVEATGTNTGHVAITSSETKNDKNGNFKFENIKFTADGTYTLEVSEVKGTDTSIKYDSKKYVVKVTVSPNETTKKYEVTKVEVGVKTEGTPTTTEVTAVNGVYPLTAEGVATFANTTKAGVEIALTGTKTLNDAAPKADAFAFKAEATGTNKTDVTIKPATVKNGADGSFTFSSIKFAKAGTYTLEISEIPDNVGTVTYDKTSYIVTVTVKSTESGFEVESVKVGEEDLSLAGGSKYVLPKQKDAQEKETATFVNSTLVKLDKVDEDNKKVIGAKLQVVGKDADGKDVVIEGWTTNSDLHVITGKLELGKTYILKEVSAPKGYKLADPVQFKVGEDGKIYLQGKDEPVEVITMTDAKLHFNVNKTELGTGDEVEGAELTIYEKQADGSWKEVEGASWTSKKGETHDFGDKLEAGKSYKLVEEVAPEGYAYTTDIEFSVGTDGTITTSAKKTSDAQGNDTYLVEDAKLHFNVNKTELGTGDEVEGAELTVYEKQADGTLKKVEGASWTSKKGETHDFGEKLEAGKTYVLREEVAPDGYGYVTDIEFTVEKDGKVTTTMPKTKDAAGNDTYLVEDARIRLEVDKRATGTGEELDGAVLELLDATGNVVESWTSKKGETHNFGGKLKAGESYTLRETIAPDGYTCVTDMKFTVGKDGTVNGLDSIKTTDANGNTVYVVEDTLNKISIQKVDESGVALAGAKLVVKDAAGKAAASWTTDGKAHEIIGLATGKYTLSEVEAPEGYQVSKDVPFEITGKEAAGSVIELSMTDTKIPESNKYSLTVTKHLHLDGITGDLAAREATYYVALFSDEAKTQRVSNVKKIEFKDATSSTVTFDKLAAGTYYVGETDENGTLLVSKIVNDKLIFHPEYTDGGKAELEGKKTEGTAEFTNVYMELPSGFYLSGQITVTKKVLVNGAEGTSDETYYARVFSDKKLGTPASDVLALDLAGGTSASVTVTDLPIGESIDSSMNYYVAETDENGKPLDPDAVTEFEISIDKSEVVLSANNSAQEVVITNSFVEEETETETETETEVEKKEAPKTGDDTDFMRYLLLMALSAGTCAIAFEEKRRRNRARK